MGIEPTWERLHAPTPDLKSGYILFLTFSVFEIILYSTSTVG
jgi:hypothetical protein